MDTNKQCGQDYFKGTSEYYSQYRIPYLDSLIQDLIKIIKINPEDKLLDLASGPDRLTIPLSKYFNEVYAVDWENEMIQEGNKKANDLNIGNIKWQTGKAEEYFLDSEIFKMVTIGDAIHRLDHSKIFDNSYKALTKGGYFCIIWSNTILTGGKEDWQKELKRITSPYKKPNIQTEKSIFDYMDDVYKEYKFENITSKKFEEKITLNIEEIIGYLYSMSVY